MSGDDVRISLLETILKLNDDFPAAVEKVSRFPWNFNGKPVVLERNVIKSVLTRFLSGALTKEDVYRWADFLEMREDVDYRPDDEDVVTEVMHELANPELEGDLTVERAKQMCNEL